MMLQHSRSGTETRSADWNESKIECVGWLITDELLKCWNNCFMMITIIASWSKKTQCNCSTSYIFAGEWVSCERVNKHRVVEFVHVHEEIKLQFTTLRVLNEDFLTRFSQHPVGLCLRPRPMRCGELWNFFAISFVKDEKFWLMCSLLFLRFCCY